MTKGAKRFKGILLGPSGALSAFGRRVLNTCLGIQANMRPKLAFGMIRVAVNEMTHSNRRFFTFVLVLIAAAISESAATGENERKTQNSNVNKPYVSSDIIKRSPPPCNRK